MSASNMQVLKIVRKMSRIKAEREARKQNDSGLSGSVGKTSLSIFSVVVATDAYLQ